MYEAIQKGSVRFGRVAEYRNNEFQAVRFSDHEEGILRRDFAFADGNARSVKIGGVHFRDVQFNNPGPHISVGTAYDAYVFCTTWGKYSKENHLKLLNGTSAADGSAYRGNPELTHYVEIDGVAFLEAAYNTARKHRLWKAGNDKSAIIGSGWVQYSHHSIPFQFNPNVVKTNDTAGTQDYLSALFVKPPRFSPEEEYRFLLRPFFPASPPADAPAMILQSDGIRRSMMKIGTVFD